MTGVAFDVELAVRRASELAEIAVALRSEAAVVAVRTAASDWTGPTRSAHDRRVRAVCDELRTAAGCLDEVALDARAAVARARRLSAERALAAAAVAAARR